MPRDGEAGAWFLQTPRLGFRTWSEGDALLANAVWGDAGVTRLVGGPFSPAAVRARLAEEMAMQRRHGVQYWPMFLLESDEFAGVCGLHPYHPPGAPRCGGGCHPPEPWSVEPAGERVYELGVHLRRELQGRGFAGEGARGVIEYAFGVLGATALFAGHHPDNERSRRLLESLGFRRTHEELYPPTGLMHRSYRLERG